MRLTKDAIDFVREVVRQPIWHIAYHEHQLPKAVAELQRAKALLERAGISLNTERAEPDDDDELHFESLEQFALSFYDEKVGSVKHHEELLQEACRNLGYSKVLLMRGNYTEIDVAEIQQSVDEEKRRWEQEDAG